MLLRAVCAISIFSTSLDCVLSAMGERQGVFAASYAWIYWVMAASLVICAVRVAVWGSEQ